MARTDPFGGQWEEEEVVIDRYASLEDAALRRGHVTSDEAGDWRGGVGGLGTMSRTRRVPIVEAEREESGRTRSRRRRDEFDPADDPLIPGGAGRRAAAAYARPPHRGRPRQDDRDMIIVER